MLKLFQRETKKLFKVFFHPTFIYLTIAGNGLLLLATFAVYELEKDIPNAQIKSYFDSLWWGVSTITTVGYGDALPQTSWGRVIGIALMYTGTALFISFTGFLLSMLTREEVEKEMAPLEKEIKVEELAQIRVDKTLKEILRRLHTLEKK